MCIYWKENNIKLLEEQGNGDLKPEFKHCFHGKYQAVNESTGHE